MTKCCAPKSGLIFLYILVLSTFNTQAQQDSPKLIQLQNYLNQEFNHDEKLKLFDLISTRQVSSEELLQYTDSTEQKMKIQQVETCYQILLSNSQKHHYHQAVRLFVIYDSLQNIKQVLLSNQEYLNIIAWYEFEHFLLKNELVFNDILSEIANFFEWKDLNYSPETENITVTDDQQQLEFSFSVKITGVDFNRDFILHPIKQISMNLKQQKCILLLKSPTFSDDKILKNKVLNETDYLKLFKSREITYNIGFRTIESDLIKYHYSPFFLDEPDSK